MNGEPHQPPVQKHEVELTLNLHLHHHGFSGGELKAMLDKLAESVSQLKETIMVTAAQSDAAFERVNVATTAIAVLIRDLITKQQAGGMTAAEEEAGQTKLLGVADALEAMAVTPTDPVPVAVPTA